MRASAHRFPLRDILALRCDRAVNENRMRYEPEPNAPYAGVIRARSNADTYDMVRDVCDATRHAVGIMRRVGWPRNVSRERAAQLMWQLCREAVQYVREDGDQLVRMPWRSLEDGRGDCKSYAVMVATMCALAGRDVVLRFVQYEGDNYYAHVFAVVDGRAVDPELTFGDECLYLYHLDKAVR